MDSIVLGIILLCMHVAYHYLIEEARNQENWIRDAVIASAAIAAIHAVASISLR